MNKIIDQNAYECLLRETINYGAEEFCLKKILVPYPLIDKWTSGWVKNDKSGLEVCFILDKINKIFPHTIFRDKGHIGAVRTCPFLDFEIILKNEPKVFEIFKKPIEQYCLQISDIFTDEEIEKLKDKLQNAHFEKFKTKILDIQIDKVPNLEPMQPEEVEILAEELAKEDDKK